MTTSKNVFATVLTYPAPSSNYRGESEENRTMLQKITKDGKEYTIVSPESIRNALREMLIKAGLPHNRSRLHNEDQLAVEFKDSTVVFWVDRGKHSSHQDRLLLGE